jgi:hypothetical protein
MVGQLFAAKELAHPKIDQTPFQIGTLHPFRHLRMLSNLCGDTLNPVAASEDLLLLLLEPPTTFL